MTTLYAFPITLQVTCSPQLHATSLTRNSKAMQKPSKFASMQYITASSLHLSLD